MTASPLAKRIGFIGAGRMATALACGYVKAGVCSADEVCAFDPSDAARQSFSAACGAACLRGSAEVVRQSEVVILAVKPQYMGEALSAMSGHVGDSQLVVSIAAGVSIATIAAELGAGRRIVRVMPNTPCLVGAGASAFAGGANATDADLELVERLLSTVGLAVRVDEALLDAVTGLSGSGPAFVFEAIEALSDGGVRMGLPREISMQLAAQTVYGAAKLLLETGEHPGVLKDAVASPGGTTIAGLHALERSGLRAAFMNAVEAAALRSVELGQSS
ncbi:MAG: pyrroline-5-carboxylate reductase [Planctomycetaceae bacterium]